MCIRDSPNTTAMCDTTLWCIQYTSEMCLGEHSIETLGEIVKKGADVNKARDVTGVLLYQPESCKVFQALEGPRSVVAELMEKIASDHRHTNVIIKKNQPLCRRMHGDWMHLDVNTKGWKFATHFASTTNSRRRNSVAGVGEVVDSTVPVEEVKEDHAWAVEPVQDEEDEEDAEVEARLRKRLVELDAERAEIIEALTHIESSNRADESSQDLGCDYQASAHSVQLVK
eukprot:TRINITY_DN763_c0_g1_i4.p1 TRINITY_DN763_c0_g1~~TRINITY_DN763_c0_g1_i4.p1  ORF type:complete len:228 (+),score=45.12 TRINITY_DN763_c0_g1_i4:96-779(+)